MYDINEKAGDGDLLYIVAASYRTILLVGTALCAWSDYATLIRVHGYAHIRTCSQSKIAVGVWCN